MHPLIISGLTSLGGSLLERTFAKATSTCETESFERVFGKLSEKLSSTSKESNLLECARSEMAELIMGDPLLSEFRVDKDAELTVSKDENGRCVFKEGKKTILTCSTESDLGKLGLAYLNLDQTGMLS